ncbi:hypothetical protein [uncultured Sphingomonas sp.]|uniref:hypothetical protein n=1 Tax=uncultured Sphingomonas sp. TaxID=158754 RepID=UPI00261BF460|nr:hypothetical protein [uncultured Sphingomonas sp.]
MARGSKAWIDEAPGGDTPFAFERSGSAAASEVVTPVPLATVVKDETPPLPILPKKALIDASEDVIAEQQKAGDWDTNTVKQVRTAI